MIIGVNMEKITQTNDHSLMKSNIGLTDPLLTQAVQQELQPLDSSNNPILNNGIIKDGGITSLYQQSVTPTVALGTPYYVYVTSTGTKILLYYSSVGITYVYVQKPNDTTPNLVGSMASVFSKRRVLPRHYWDVCISSNGTSLIGIYSKSNAALNLTMDEISISDFSVIQSYSFPTTGRIINAKIAKANTLTFASVRDTSGVVCATNNSLLYCVGGVVYQIVSTTLLPTWYSADNLSAVWNAGRIIVASPYDSNLSSAGLYWNSFVGSYTSGNYANYTQGGIQGIVIAPVSNLNAAAITLTAYVSTYSTNIPVFNIIIDAAGGTTHAATFGTTYNSSGTSGNFTMQSGVVTPWGCSGIYSTTAAAPYGVFIGPYYKDNTPNTTAPIAVPDLTHTFYSQVPLTIDGGTFDLGINSFKGNISFLSINYIAQTIPVPINDIGGAGYETDIISGNIFGGSKYNGCFIPPEYRSEVSTDAVNGAGIIYRTNNKTFIYAQFGSYLASLNYINPQEICAGVVRFNTCAGNGNIIDTNTYTSYNDYSGFGVPFLFNYTNTTSLSYTRSFNKYSSSLDAGLLYVDTAITNTKTFTYGLSDIYKLTQFDTILWAGATGAYFGNIGTQNGPTCYIYSVSQYGTYVYNQNVPPGNDATYYGYGILMPLSAAMQTPDYAGYMFPNLLPTSKYKNFFILKGSFFAYDGQTIYALVLTNGIGSTLSAVPQPLVTPQGLQYLTASCDYAFFLCSYDNSIWLYSGARQIVKGPVFSAKPTITAGWFNDFDNALYLQTANSIITVRDDQYVTENVLPFSSGTWNTFNTNLGLYFVQNNTVILRAYENVTSSTLIPLNYQTGYLGYQSSKMFTVNKILIRMNCQGGLESNLALTWNWVTQDNSGIDTASILTSPLSNSGYFTFEYTPPHNNVLLFSLGIQDTSGTQKIVLLNIDAYTTYVGEMNVSNKVL
jgi:hypothetical protein